MFEISFGSDNHSGVHPLVMKALQDVNVGYCPAYGDDPLTQSVIEQIQRLFGGDCEAYLVMTGTGANVLSLQCMLSSYHAVFCANTSHINVDECGAVQKNTQARLSVIDSPDGKLTPGLIMPRLLGNRDQHHSQPRVISISQSTEYGTLYSLQEIRDLADFAHSHGMCLHMDGARLANAAAALDTDFETMCKDTGCDIVSLGGTKNGMLFGEAIISYRPELTANLRFYRKQCNQLFSKMRYVSAQMQAYLADELWRKNALHANRMTALLADELSKIEGVSITQKPQVNSVFVCLPHQIIQPLQEEFHFYTWDEERDEVRLMCSFNTSPQHIQSLCGRIRALL